MKRSLSLVLILVLLASGMTLFTGCSEEKEMEYPVTVGGLTIEKEPKSVVVLNDSFADIIAYIGYDTKLVARSDECDQEFLSFFPSVGSVGSVTAASILQQGTDLVIADNTLSESVRSELNANEVPVVILSPATNMTSLKQLYIDLGTVLGGKTVGSKRAERAYNSLVNMLGEYKNIPTDAGKTSVYLYLNENAELCTFTHGSFEQQLFEYNTSVNTLSQQKDPQVIASELKTGSPSCIFYDNDAVLEYLKNDETLMNLKALQNLRVCRIPRKSFFRYGMTCEQILGEMSAFLNDGATPIVKPATPDEASPDEASPDEAPDDYDDDDDYEDDYDDDYSDDYSDDDSDWSDGDGESWDD